MAEEPKPRKRRKKTDPAPAPAAEARIPAAAPGIAPEEAESLEDRIAKRLRGEGPVAPAPEPAAAAGDEAPKEKAKPEEKGLRCPTCGCGHMPVLYTRPHLKGKIARVRRCRNCGRRTTTYEATAGSS